MSFFRAVIYLLIRSKIYQYIAYQRMRLMECTECEMSAPGAYDIDIEADDINVTDTATVIWEIA